MIEFFSPLQFISPLFNPLFLFNSLSKEDLSNINEINNIENKINEYKQKKKVIDSIYLNGNQFSKFDEEDFEKLREISDNKLKMIDLSKNILSSISIPTDFSSILTLDLSYNRLKEIPSEICLLKHLRNLYVQNNHLTKLPISISKLICLKRFNFSENLVAIVPLQLNSCISLKEVSLKHNPLIDPPYKISKKGWKAIINYWRNQSHKRESEANKPNNIDDKILSSLSICKSRFTAKNQRAIKEYQETIMEDDPAKEEELEQILRSKSLSKNFYQFLLSIKKQKYILFFEKVAFYESSFTSHFRNDPQTFNSTFLEEDSLPPILFFSSPEENITQNDMLMSDFGSNAFKFKVDDFFLSDIEKNSKENDYSGMILDIHPKKEAQANQFSIDLARDLIEEFVQDNTYSGILFSMEMRLEISNNFENKNINSELFKKSKNFVFKEMVHYVDDFQSSPHSSNSRTRSMQKNNLF